MRLEMGNFYVTAIQFGSETSYHEGVLTINKEEALAVVKEDQHITEAELYLVNPGDEVRMCPVKEVIEPRTKLDGKPVFPGYTGELG